MRKLLDVEVDAAFVLDLAKVLKDYRIAPEKTDFGLPDIAGAVRHETRLMNEAIKSILLLMERRRAGALDSELLDAVDRVRDAHTAMCERLALREKGGG